MIVRPAVDLRDGQCVQLVGGSYDDELIRLPDPVGVAHDWINKGFRHLHVIDLDRATGRGSNVSVIESIGVIARENSLIDIRVGGGIRSSTDIDEMLDFGVNQVVVGSKAVREPDWFEDCVRAYPNKLCVAIEVDGREVRVDGWQASSEKSLEELVTRFGDLKIGGILVTAIHVEGRRQGTDQELFSYIRSLTELPIIASGGVTTIDDIKQLETTGISEVVVGAAIYTHPDLAIALQDEQYN